MRCRQGAVCRNTGGSSTGEPFRLEAMHRAAGYNRRNSSAAAGAPAGGTMYFKQFYLGCLAHASYLIGSDGEAAAVDPQRDVDQYIDEAASLGLAIKYVVETHLHADFVSGHHELAERTGARIYLGAESGATFAHTAVKDGDSIHFGQCRFDFLETPGHTQESICIAMTDLSDASRPQAIFTGDTLFVGDVGRPDL